MTATIHRRRVLTATAGAVAAGLAGCLDGVRNTDATDDPVENSAKDGTADDGTENDGTADPPEETDASGEPGDPGAFVTVGIRAEPWFKFEPNLVHIVPGGTVHWEVVDDYRHAVASYHPETHGHQRIPDEAAPWQSGLLRDGSTFEHTFEVEGIHDYVDVRSLCSSHEAIGGVGRVIVGWPDIGSEPAYQHDAETLPSRAPTVFEDIDDRSYELLG